MKTYVCWAAVPALILIVLIVSWSSMSGSTVASHPDSAAHAVLKARLEMARGSEFGLIIDLSQSEMELVHASVPMRTMKVRRGGGIPAGTLIQGRVAGRHGTLPFEPIQRVVAPRDTALADAPAMRPLDAHPAYGIIRLDNGVEIRFIPHDLGPLDVAWVTAYRTGHHMATAGRMLVAAISGSPAPDAPVISVRISDADARAVYRALPEGAPVVIRGR